MNKYTILISSDALAESLAEELNNLKNDDSVINADDEISVISEYNEGTDFDVFVGIGDTANEHVKCLPSISKPVLLCDVDCSKLKRVNPESIPSTWGLFSRGNKDKEIAFLKHFNLSFVYNEGADKVRDYIAPLVFHMLEEFSFHNKYNDNFAYEKQAEFIHEFTQFYLDKMKRLAEAEGFVREDIKGDFNHIVYRYRPDDAEKPFRSINGRDYDFIIEYHRNKPSEGIYYGVKGEVISGNLEEQCEKFRKEWPNIFMMDRSKLQKIYDDMKKKEKKEDIFWGYNFQLELTEILNNTFPWKDYLKCYKPTDNMWEKRYWLFWVTLNDDEDIVCVAARAVKLMAKTFERCIVGNCIYMKPDMKKNESKTPKLQLTSFTNEAFNELTIKINKGTNSENNYLIEKLMTREFIEKDERYECCYLIYKRKGIVAFSQMVESIIQEYDSINRVPWGMVDRVFLPYTLNPSKDTFKTELSNFKKEEKKNTEQREKNK